MREKRIQKQVLFWTALVFTVMVVLGTANAMEFEYDNGVKVDCDVTVGYGGALRVKDQDPKKLTAANINADDGNRNFDQWDMINNRFNTIADIDVQYKDFGVFVRPRAFYDFAYTGDNSNDSPKTNNNLIAGTISKTDEFDNETEKAHGRRAEILDAFAYAGFDLGERNLQVRAGRQVIQWGESLYIGGGISAAMAYADATAANAPGVEVKEIYLPSTAVSAQMDITDTVSFGTFYQFEWEKTLLNESGSYFATSDFLDEAGHRLITAAGILARGEDDEPDDMGQFGVSMMYRADWLAQTEFGLYFLNYHEKTPQVITNIPAKSYYLTYAEDVKLYGASFSSQVGSANVSGEVSYRQDYPLAATLTSRKKCNFIQSQISWLYSYGATPFSDQFAINGEVAADRVLAYENADLAGKDKFAWGYSLTLNPQWYQLLTDLDLAMPFTYKGNPNGSSVNGIFTEEADSGSVGFEFTYRNVYKVNLKYVDYFNSSRNALSDRDYVALDLKYTF